MSAVGLLLLLAASPAISGLITVQKYESSPADYEHTPAPAAPARLCQPQTPCRWLIYDMGQPLEIVNEYCVCPSGEVCGFHANRTEWGFHEYRCKINPNK